MWKQKLHQNPSAGEFQLFLELRRRNLHYGLITQHGFTFNVEKDGVQGCRTDFFWPLLNYAVFLDGAEAHSGTEEKDMLIVKALERRGYTVDRYMYKAPLTKKKLKEITDKIERQLKKLEKKTNKCR